MKNLRKVLALTFLCVPFSCIDQDAVLKGPKDNFPGVFLPTGVTAAALPPPGSIPNMTSFNALLETQLNQVYHLNSNYIYDIQTHLFFNYERFLRNQVGAYNTAFASQTLNVTTFSDGFNFSSLPTSLVKPSQIAEVSLVYNSTQLTILDTYTVAMSNATGHTHYLNASLQAAQAVGNSSLTNEEKIEVMAFVNAGVKLAEDFFYNESNFVKTVIVGEIGPPTSSASNCKVNFRNVWIGAVVGGTVGAVAGVKIGAAGGTMTFPGVGTVTGALGGGVIGFATGFAGSALTGIAAELLGSCFRPSHIRDTSAPYGCESYNAIAFNVDCLEFYDKKIIWRRI